MRAKMKRSRKSKSISWASGVNLCQVKLYSTEDCPSEVGQKFQNHLQAKASRMFHSSCTEMEDLPPGFEQSHFSSQPELRLSQIPQVQWKCPVKFILCSTWRVASGEESEEAKLQSERNARMLEAHYPRFSAIPSSPSVYYDVEIEHNDDSCTPVVPLAPIEETEGEDLPHGIIKPEVNTIRSEPPASSEVLIPSRYAKISKVNSSALESLLNSQPAFGKLPDTGADVVTAAAAAVAAVTRSKENGSLIDTDLLIKILSDPKMIQNLITDAPSVSSTSASSNTFSEPRSGLSMVTPNAGVPNFLPKLQNPAGRNLSPVLDTSQMTVTQIPPQPDVGLMQEAPSLPLSTPVSMVTRIPTQPDVGLMREASSLPLSTPVSTSVLLSRPSNGNFFPMPNPVRSTMRATSAHKNTAAKDINYYKNLVRQHGDEKKEIQETFRAQTGNNNNHFQVLKMVHNLKHEHKLKISKPCIYFKSPKGCRNGVSCPYQHDNMSV